MTDNSPLLSRLSKDEDNTSPKKQETALFKERWLMLAFLTLLTVDGIMQWIFYSPVAKSTQRYFDVSFRAIEYLTISGMIVLTVFVVPCVWVVQQTSVRTGCLINGSLNTTAALIKYLGCYYSNNTGYVITLIGQIASSIATCFILPMPAELSARWFSSNERSTATSMSASGHFLGISLGCFLSTVLVGNTGPVSTSRGLQYGQLCLGLISLVLTTAVFFLFQSEPSIPPSKSQAMSALYDLKLTYRESLKALAHNVDYCVFLIGFGIIFGAMYAFWAITEETLTKHFLGPEYEIGFVGTVSAIFGVPGMLIGGLWLDRRKTYKSSSVLVSLLLVIISLAYTLLIKYTTSIAGVYIVGGMYGFLISSFISIGFVLADEITYPVPPIISSGLLLISAKSFGIVLTLATSLINSNQQGVVFSSGLLTIATFFASVLMSFVKPDLKRYVQDLSNNNLE